MKKIPSMIGRWDFLFDGEKNFCHNSRGSAYNKVKTKFKKIFERKLIKMATREENLKKINAEIEKLSDEELEKVAGGTIGQTAGDSQILYDYGLMDKYYGTIPVMFYWKSKSAEVDAGWAKAGITCVTKPFGNNQYFLNGQEISRGKAYEHLKANFKRIHQISDD